MYKYYLEDLGLLKPSKTDTFINLVKKLSHSTRNLIYRSVSSVEFLEAVISSKVFKIVEGKPEKEQRKLVEYVFIAHKVLLGASLAALYFLTS